MYRNKGVKAGMAEARRRRKKKQQSEYFFDYSLLFIVLFLLGFGLIMVYSASSYEAYDTYGDAAFYMKKQLIANIIGLVGMIIIANIPYHFWERFAMLGYVVSMILIFLVKTPLGISSHGATRWIGIPLELIISLNYFGTVAIAKGVYDLLQKKHGSCVVTVSNTISQGAGRKDIVDLLNNIGDEKRVLSLVSSMDSTNLSVGNSLYVSTKYALARWVRRVSATWAANGVRINAVAPGNVHTAMTATMSTTAKMALNALPIPTKYGQECLMAPEEIAEVMVFLASDSARGVNGNIMFVDGGTDALLNSEKVY